MKHTWSMQNYGCKFVFNCIIEDKNVSRCKKTYTAGMHRVFAFHTWNTATRLTTKEKK